MKVTSTICALLAMISIPTPVNAQNGDAMPLAGLRAFQIVIEKLDDEDETRCGVTRTGLYASLRSALGQSDMDVTDDARTRDGFIYLSATVLSNCTAFISLEVKTVVRIEKTGARVYAPVWERGHLRTGFRGASAAAAIGQTVEDTAKLLVSEWSSVNK
jgi:hypothetical protein